MLQSNLILVFSQIICKEVGLKINKMKINDFVNTLNSKAKNNPDLVENAISNRRAKLNKFFYGDVNPLLLSQKVLSLSNKTITDSNIELIGGIPITDIALFSYFRTDEMGQDGVIPNKLLGQSLNALFNSDAIKTPSLILNIKGVDGGIYLPSFGEVFLSTNANESKTDNALRVVDSASQLSDVKDNLVLATSVFSSSPLGVNLYDLFNANVTSAVIKQYIENNLIGMPDGDAANLISIAARSGVDLDGCLLGGNCALSNYCEDSEILEKTYNQSQILYETSKITTEMADLTEQTFNLDAYTL